MNLTIALLRKPLLLAVTSCVLLCGSSRAQGPNQEGPATTNGGLELRIREGDAGPGGPRFVVELHNNAERDLVLNLGEVIGDKQVLHVSLTVTDERGKSHNLVDSRVPTAIAGSIYPMPVPLCMGCTFSFPVDFGRYVLIDSPKLNPGFYSIQAHFASKRTSEVDRAVGVTSNWTGEVTSNRLEFKISQ